jgi:PAS domain S-box-containing protein
MPNGDAPPNQSPLEVKPVTSGTPDGWSYRQVLECLDAMVWIMDAQASLLYSNRAWQAFFGPLSSADRADFWKERIHPSDHPKWLEICQRALPGHESFELEMQMRDAGGAMRWIALQAGPLSRSPSELLGFIGTARDMTERRDAEQRLRQFARSVEQSPCSIVVTDTRGRIEYVNPKFTEVTGYTMAEVLGRNPRILKSGNRGPEDYRQLWETITAGGEWRGEFQNRRKSGEVYWEFASISPVRDAAGQITHFIGVKEDITDRKRIEAEREALIVQLQDALANVRSLRGLLPICANCKKIRDDRGYWKRLEAYIQEHSEATFSHGICPDCSERLYGISSGRGTDTRPGSPVS